MSGATRLILVRHGESRWNVEERYQGHADSGLTAVGIEQAEAAAKVLKARFGRPDLVVSSDLPRAWDTAQAFLRLAGGAAERDPRLRESDVGDWAGRTFTEIAAEYPDVLAEAARGGDPRRGGGETFTELRQRVWAALVDIAEQAGPGRSVMVFCHGGPIRVAAAAALGIPEPGHLAFAPPVNTSVTVIDYGRERGNAVVEYNAPTAWAADATRTD
ncbi:histidine phosphatase family protein [Nonomuraea sp. NPDC049309]|uniref:histidine phosphatase family protein n=1 Tax=Nonomuraea sp. NPDC049309 TaxID=3364350 RepID=UPI003717A90F